MPRPDDHASDLSQHELGALLCLAGLMIPAHAGCGVPGANDPRIFDAIVSAARTRKQEVRHALAQLDRFAGARFALLCRQRQWECVHLLRSQAPTVEAVFVSLVASCYYRDDRVMRALAMEVRAPFPAGFALEAGDWSLLEPVRGLAPRYRVVD